MKRAGVVNDRDPDAGVCSACGEQAVYREDHGWECRACGAVDCGGCGRMCHGDCAACQWECAVDRAIDEEREG